MIISHNPKTRSDIPKGMVYIEAELTPWKHPMLSLTASAIAKVEPYSQELVSDVLEVADNVAKQTGKPETDYNSHSYSNKNLSRQIQIRVISPGNKVTRWECSMSPARELSNLVAFVPMTASQFVSIEN